jgi:hypothetical protein
MNFSTHYIFISKLIHKLSEMANHIYRFLPINWLINFKYVKKSQINSKIEFQKQLKKVVGNFDHFQTYCDQQNRATILEIANDAMNNHFELLGSGKIKLDPINWHIDFKSGYVWDNGLFYKKYKIIDINNDADVKLPWELSRASFFLSLGQAYLLTKDDKYANKIVQLISHWIDENKLMHSINWTCTMDVSIRAVNWMYALNMIVDSAALTYEVIAKVHRSLLEHGFYIFNNLEKSFPFSANHYASNIAGLLFIGSLYKDAHFGSVWYNFAKEEYGQELRSQVLPNGVHFEKSISYHRLMVELFIYPYLVMKRNNEFVEIDLEYKLQSMFNFTFHYLRNDGTAPMIGDDDNARLLSFTNFDFFNHEYLLNISNAIFNTKFYSSIKNCPEVFFLCAENSNQLNLEEYLKPSSVFYKDVGFTIMRNDDYYIFINNSGLSKHPNARKKINGTHTHCDLLSFDYSIGNNHFIVDPGTYVYTSSAKLRNEFRSTSKHNTLMIDNLDIHNLPVDDLFSVEDFAYPTLNDYAETNQLISLKAAHSGYEKIGVKHTRLFEFQKEDKVFSIIDNIISDRQHDYHFYFHFAENMMPKIENECIIIEANDGSKIQLAFRSNANFKLKIINDTVSPSYGILRDSYSLVVETSSDSNIDFTTSIKQLL